MPSTGSRERRLRLLTDTGSLLVAPPNLDEALAAVARLAVSGLAECAIIDVDADGAPGVRVAAAVEGRQHAGLVRALTGRDGGAGGPAGRNGQSLQVVELRPASPEPRDPGAVRATLARHGLSTLLVTPLRADERSLGSLTLATVATRRFDAADASFAAELGRLLGLAIDGFRLREEIARRHDEADALASVARRVSVSRDAAGELDHIADVARRLSDSDTALVVAYDDRAGDLVLRAWAGSRERALDALRPGPNPGVAARVFASGVPLRAGGERAAASGGRGGPPAPDEILAEAAVPIRVDGAIWGVLAVVDRGPRRFGAHEEAVLLRLADYAALAIRSPRPAETAPRSRGLAKGLAALGRLIADSLEPDDVAQWMTESVCLLLRARAACLFRWEVESRRLVGVALTGALEVPKSGELVFPESDGLAGLALRQRQAVWTTNALIDPRVQFSRPMRTWMERSSLRSGLAAPLTLGETVIGTLVVWSEVGREFESDEVLLLQTFADQATIVLSNARRSERGAPGAEEIVRREWRGMLQEIADGAWRDTEADVAFVAATEGDPAGAASVVFAGEGDLPAGTTVPTLATGPWRRVLRWAAAQAADAGQVVRAAQNFGEIVWIEDCRDQPGLAEDPIGRVLLRQEVLTCAVVPLRYLGAVVGLLGVGYRRPTVPHAALLASLGKLSEQAAASLAGRRARARLRALAASQERTRIGHELHDMLSQVLFSVALKLDWCSTRLPRGSAVRPKLEEIRRETGLVMRTIREMIAGRAAGSGEAGAEPDTLPARLRALAATFRELTGVPIDLSLPRDVEPSDETSGDVLYKVFQEALANVAKHARASRVAVRLQVRGGRAEFEVADDGVGLPRGRDAASLFRSPEHFGLRQLAERLEELGGHLEVTASAPTGLRLRGALPWPAGPRTAGPRPGGA